MIGCPKDGPDNLPVSQGQIKGKAVINRVEKNLFFIGLILRAWPKSSSPMYLPILVAESRVVRTNVFKVVMAIRLPRAPKMGQVNRP